MSQVEYVDINELATYAKNAKNLDMPEFGFADAIDIDWDNVDEISEENYSEPNHEMLECPKCHHVDRTIHFKKV